MMKIYQIKHQFVDYIPTELDTGVLYVSIAFTTAIHKCYCGCGREVTTPIAPNGWSLTFNGESVSLAPSIGSRNLKCKSHYWIQENNVRWLLPFSGIEPESIHSPRRMPRILNWVKQKFNKRK